MFSHRCSWPRRRRRAAAPPAQPANCSAARVAGQGWRGERAVRRSQAPGSRQVQEAHLGEGRRPLPPAIMGSGTGTVTQPSGRNGHC
eukprot:7301772-Alexandrium_andersonii.AAC.1